MTKTELDLALLDAQSYYRGIRRAQQERGQPTREPFFMSRAMRERIEDEALRKEKEAYKIKQEITRRIAELQEEAMVKMQDDYCSKGVYIA